MADPVSHTAIMSWITEELEKNKFLAEEGEQKRTKGRFSQSPLRELESIRSRSLERITETYVFRGSTIGIQ